jgi:hypothetical protein
MLEALCLPLEHLLGFLLELRPDEGSEVRGRYAARAASSEPSVARRILLGKPLNPLPSPVFDFLL